MKNNPRKKYEPNCTKIESELRHRIQKMVRNLARLHGVEQKEIWSLLKAHFGNSQTTADIPELKEREKLLIEWESEVETELSQQNLYAYKDSCTEEGFSEELHRKHMKEISLPPLKDSPIFRRVVESLKKSEQTNATASISLPI